jgi:sugar (pentulose or hexulose) kinase
MVPVLGDGERDDPTLRGALLEGVAFGIRDHLDRLGAASTPPTELRVSGRSADLREWNQVKADVLGIPVIRIPGDAAARGVAMLAGLGVQMYRDPADATAAACRADAPVDPDPHNHERYADIYARYRSVVASSLVHTTPEV